MRALTLFTKHAPNRTFLAVVFGALSGLFYAFLIPIVISALSSGENLYSVRHEVVEVIGIEIAYSRFAYLFAGLCLAIIVLRCISEIVLARLALDIRFMLRKELYDQVQNSSIESLEKVGASRLIQALSTDVAAIVNGAQLLPVLLTSSVTLISMLGYLFYIDSEIFKYVAVLIVVGVIIYQIPVFFGTRYFSKAREFQDTLQEGFKGLIEGSKELKLSSTKAEVYRDEVLYTQEESLLRLEKRGFSIYSLANNFGELLSFLAIGGLSFILINYQPISTEQVIAAVMVLLYVTGPIGVMLNFIPELARAKISLKKIDLLFKELPTEGVSKNTNSQIDWESIQLKDVKYQYSSEDNSSSDFGVGPINATIKRGEITFITGGNGSGKSTLAKVISQFYLPMDGHIFYDETLINSGNLTDFRNTVSCIYSDYYLFDRLLVKDGLIPESKIAHYLKAFGIDDKVKLDNGKFSTLKLSDGQRRRLALVVSIVEGKDLLIFDEWAADQDPQFKDVFYHEILPFLKSKNKAVVVISHDDRFFHVADQMLVMESGRLVG